MTLVPAPLKFPNGCIKCGSTKGPIWDGGVVTAMELTLYICRMHAEEIAREYGLTDGEEMDRLRDAAAELAQRDREAERFAAQQADSARIISGLNAQLAKTEGERDEALGLVSTMEHQAKDVGRLAAALVGGGDPED